MAGERGREEGYKEGKRGEEERGWGQRVCALNNAARARAREGDASAGRSHRHSRPAGVRAVNGGGWPCSLMRGRDRAQGLASSTSSPPPATHSHAASISSPTPAPLHRAAMKAAAIRILGLAVAVGLSVVLLAYHLLPSEGLLVFQPLGGGPQSSSSLAIAPSRPRCAFGTNS